MVGKPAREESPSPSPPHLLSLHAHDPFGIFLRNSMNFNFASVLVYIVVSIGFIFGSLTVGRIIRPHRPTPEKLSTYECGEDTIGSSWVQFNVRFYIIALIFLIFDVEAAFLYPWVLVLREGSWPLFWAVMVFVALILVGLIYIWRKGGLEWR